MLEFYFSYRGVLTKLAPRIKPRDHVAPVPWDGFHLSRIARFSHFAAEHYGSEPISPTIVGRYLRTLGAGSPRIAAVTALEHARRVAPHRFVRAEASVVDDPDAALLSSFSTT